MRRTHSVGLGAILMVVATGLASATSPRPLVAGEQRRLHANCEGKRAADTVAIVAGFSARGLKAVEVGAALDETARRIEARAREIGGTVQLGDRLRGARPVSLRNERDDAVPYVAVQLIDIVFPANADIERAIDALVPLGLDRFGKNIRVDSTTSLEVFVFYRISDPDAWVDEILAACRRKTLEQHCAAPEGIRDAQLCRAEGTQQALSCMTVESGILSVADDYSARSTINLEANAGRGSGRPFEARGRSPMTLRGSVVFGYAPNCLDR